MRGGGEMRGEGAMGRGSEVESSEGIQRVETSGSFMTKLESNDDDTWKGCHHDDVML